MLRKIGFCENILRKCNDLKNPTRTNTPIWMKRSKEETIEAILPKDNLQGV